MSHNSIVIFLAILAGPGDGGQASVGVDDLSAYHAAAVKAGKDPDAHLRLALWCEAHGLIPEREKEVAETLRLNPNHAAARGLSGMVRTEWGWLKVDEVAAKLESDPVRRARLAAYDAARDKADDSAHDQMKLAAWCTAQGLFEDSHAHYAAALRRDQNLPEVWRKLGYKFHGEHWVNDSLEAHAKKQFAEAKTAFHSWETRLVRLGRERAKPETLRQADKELATVKDPQAAPAIWSVFVSGGERYHNIAVRLLDQIDDPEGSTRLALLALFENEVPVRNPAIEALSRRDPREFVGPVIDYLRKPLKIEVREALGPDQPGLLIVDGQLVREYDIPTLAQYRDSTRPPSLPPAFNPNAFAANPAYYLGTSYQYTVTYQPSNPAMFQAFQMAAANPGAVSQIFTGLAAGHHSAPPPMIFNVAVPYYPVHHTTSSYASQANARRAARDLQREYDNYVKSVKAQLKNDAAALERYNARLQEVTAHALEILQRVTGLAFGPEQADWGAWWTDWSVNDGHLPAPNAGPGALPPPPAPAVADKLHRSRLEAGTTVWTNRGKRAIETLRTGDRVLTQDPHTGALSYALVVEPTRAAADDLLRLSLTGRTALSVTPLERLWRAGQGWVAAANLKPGDAVRVLGDVLKVESIEALPAKPTYNVALLEGSGIFAGDAAVLVHDNGIVHGTVKPFDAVNELNANGSSTAGTVGRR